MKKFFWLGLAGLAALIVFFDLHLLLLRVILTPDGRTTESRQALLEETGYEYFAAGQEIPPGTMLGEVWRIEAEKAVGEHIVSGAYSLDGRAGIMVFEPGRNGRYKIQSKRTAGQSEIIIEHLISEGTVYDVIWFCGAPTEYALVTITPEGGSPETVRYDADLIILESSARSYTLEATYYDAAGNAYK